MPLKKFIPKVGVNRENTRYTNEGGWFESDKVRFRQGTPEVIGGWARISSNVFVGVCRSLWNWVTLANLNLVGVGTNLKFYIENGGAYNDITPLRTTATLTNPFTTVNLSTTVTVAHTAHGCVTGDYVTYSNVATVGGLNLNGEYSVTVTGLDSYTIQSATAATSGATGGGTVIAVYQINVGFPYQIPLTGWGAGAWGAGTWGNGGTSSSALRLWSQSNFGQDLILGFRGSPIYYWDADYGLSPTAATITIAAPGVITSSLLLTENSPVILTNEGFPSTLPTGLVVGTTYYVKNVSGTSFNLSATPGGGAITTSGTQSGTHYILPNAILVTSLSGASDVPIIQNFIFVSDISRFVFCFGCNDLGSSTQDPMLIRWSDQESVTMWTPSATNQAGSIRLSHGSELITAIQTRQEIVVWSDSAVYSLQYLGPPTVWGTQLLGDNISIISPNAVAQASGMVFWMGIDKFYSYDGRVQTLNCDLLKYVYQDINLGQSNQVFSSTNEGFNEIWWFYCSANAVEIDSYVVYNYLEKCWYYGSMARTAWLDSGLRDYPLAAGYNYNLINHELGVDNNETGTTQPIDAYISSAEFDIEDGDKFGFVWRMLPDLTFAGSTSGTTPQITMTLYPLQNSGSGTGTAVSAGVSQLTGAQYTITEGFTGQVNTRIRGRQLILKISSNRIGTTWQLGATRIDIKPDGRR
jgi:hypothetical protein